MNDLIPQSQPAQRPTTNVSESLLLQALSDIGILSERMLVAERQRQELVEKMDLMLEKQHQFDITAHIVSEQAKELALLTAEQKLNTEFRLRFMGGSTVAKLVWIALGGGAVWFIQKILERSH